jgi:hypothetical protein
MSMGMHCLKRSLTVTTSIKRLIQKLLNIS